MIKLSASEVLCEKYDPSFFRTLRLCSKVLQKNKLQIPSTKKQTGKIQLFKEHSALREAIYICRA